MNHRYSTYALVGMLTIIMIGAVMGYLQSGDIDEICASDNMSLYRVDGVWGCGNATILNITYNITDLSEDLWNGNYSNFSAIYGYALNGTNTTNLSYFNLNSANTVGNFNQSFNASTLFIDSASGRVGIGKTNPSYILDVLSPNESIATFRGPAGYNLAIVDAGTDGVKVVWSAKSSQWASMEAHEWYSTFSSSRAFQVSTAADAGGAGWIKFAPLGVEAMRISYLGNVGVGTSTPANKLAVNGTASFGSGGIYFTNTTEATFGRVSGNTGTGEVGINYNTYSEGNPTTSSFGVYNGTTNLFEILPSGRVGIGTANPSYKLDIVSGTTSGARITSTNNLPLRLSEGGTNMNIDFSVINASGDLRIGNGTAYFMTIRQSTGNVGINITAPTSTLHTIGTFNISNISNYPVITTNSNGNITFDNSGLFFDAVSNRLGIGTTAPNSLLTVGSGYTASNMGELVTLSGSTDTSLGSKWGMYELYYANPTSATSNTVGALGFSARSSGTKNQTGTFWGVYGTVANQGSGYIGVATGVQGGISLFGSENGSIGTGIALRATQPTRDATDLGANLTNAYGLWIDNQSETFVNRGYGIYIKNQSGAITKSYSIYSEDGDNYFGGKIGIGVLNPQNALNVVGTFNISNSSAYPLITTSAGGNITLGNNKISVINFTTGDTSTITCGAVYNHTMVSNASGWYKCEVNGTLSRF